ncbi:MAG: phosphatidate cytidylyltransferase [Litorimonas sp.]
MAESSLQKPKFSGVGIRLLSAIGMVLLCLAPFYFGGWLWAALAGLFGGRMLFEWVRMSDPLPAFPAYLTPILGLLAGIVYTVQYNFGYAALCILISAIAVAGIQAVRPSSEKKSRIIWAVLGVFYILVPTLLMVGLRGNEVGFDTVGFQRLLFVIACVIGADVGAYFGGSTIGGPKLAPKLSPNKTWSGFFSGQILAVILGVLFGHLVGIGWLSGAILALPIAILSVLGDLFESGVKRTLNVKDTGGLMPGHGGLLDRLDSLMAAIVGVAIILVLFPGVWPT